MEKPIIAVDFEGALLNSRPFKEAHKKWFYLMSFLLKDEYIKKYVNSDNYFEKVDEIMLKLLGNISKEKRTEFARNIFSMLLIAEVNEKYLVKDFVDYLFKLKDKYSLVLITSAPEKSLDSILLKLNLSNLFDILYKTPEVVKPNKKQLLLDFIKKYTKPSYYIGEGDDFLAFCKEKDIKTISVNWVSKAECKGDFDVFNVSDLRNVFG